MDRLLSVARAYTLGMLTYRTRTAISLLSVLVAVVPVYFVAGALQPLAASAIASESSEYFTYLIVGSVASFVMAEAVSAIPSLVNSYITSGTLEQLLITPIRWPSLLAGLSAYGFAWVAVRALCVGDSSSESPYRTANSSTDGGNMLGATGDGVSGAAGSSGSAMTADAAGVRRACTRSRTADACARGGHAGDREG